MVIQALLELAGFAVVVGLIGSVVAAGLASMKQIQATEHGVQPLAALLPNLPTWWIPETVMGYTTAVVLALLAIAMANMGRKFERYL